MNMKKAMATLWLSAATTVALANGQVIPATQAIDIAEKEVQGKAYKLDLDNKRGASRYEVDVLANGAKHEVRINAQTGQVLDNRMEQDDDDDGEHAAALQAQISLQQAIRIAEKRIGSRVTEAEFDLKRGRAYYDVETKQNGRKQKVVIDANTGAIISTR